MLDKFITYIVCWYKTLFQVCRLLRKLTVSLLIVKRLNCYVVNVTIWALQRRYWITKGAFTSCKLICLLRIR